MQSESFGGYFGLQNGTFTSPPHAIYNYSITTPLVTVVTFLQYTSTVVRTLPTCLTKKNLFVSLHMHPHTDLHIQHGKDQLLWSGRVCHRTTDSGDGLSHRPAELLPQRKRWHHLAANERSGLGEQDNRWWLWASPLPILYRTQPKALLCMNQHVYRTFNE